MLHKRLVLLFATTLLILAGCQSPLYNQTEGNVADVKLRTEAARHQSDSAIHKEPSLVVNQGLYVDKTPISLARQPTWLKNRIILKGGQLPFSYYSRTVGTGGGQHVLMHYQTGLDPSTMVSISYSGSVKGALDLLAAKTGYTYLVNGNNIYWQALVTKTFDIAFMPGASDYSLGKSSAGGSTTSVGGGGGGGGGGAGGGTVTSAIIDDSAAQQFSSLKGSLSIWKDLETSIQQLLSPQGKVMVSEATTTVTVRDKPSNVALVSRFIGNLNSNLSKQVLVKVQVLEVILSSDFNYGINWKIVQRTFGGSTVQLVANYGTPVTIKPLTGATTLPTTGINFGSDRESGFQMLVNALKQQGKVSVVTEPRVVCLNNQVSVIRIVNQEGYLASVQTTNLAGGTGSSGSSVTSQLTPGTLVTGLTLYVLPKILGNKVYLQINADLSNSLGIDKVSSSPDGSTSTNASAIQVPRVSQKQFNQRSVIDSGETLILSGFRRVQNETGAMQLFDSQSLGGKAAAQDNTETIVLITPIILRGLT